MSLVYVFKEHRAGLNAGRFQKSFVCATHPSEARFETGGASRDRTDDPLLAKQVLSQLSYGPRVLSTVRTWMCGLLRGTRVKTVMVGLGGLEPPASPLSGVRSNHLSYRPKSRA